MSSQDVAANDIVPSPPPTPPNQPEERLPPGEPVSNDDSGVEREGEDRRAEILIASGDTAAGERRVVADATRSTLGQSGTQEPQDPISEVTTSWPRQSSCDPNIIKRAADCYHKQDYGGMITILRGEPSTVTVLFGRALAFYKLHGLVDATKCLKEMDKLASRETSQKSSQYLANYYLGEIEFDNKKYILAADFYQKASKFYSPANNVANEYRVQSPTLFTVSCKLGSALINAGQCKRAIEVYEGALGFAGSQEEELAAHNSLGHLFERLKNDNCALQQYKHTITLAEKLNNYKSLGWANGNAGNTCLRLNQKEDALKYLERSLDLIKRHDPAPQAIARACCNLGNVYQSQNRLKKAKECYDQALSERISKWDLFIVCKNYNNLLKKMCEEALSEPISEENLNIVCQNYSRLLRKMHAATIEFSSKNVVFMTCIRNRILVLVFTPLQGMHWFHAELKPDLFDQLPDSVRSLFNGDWRKLNYLLCFTLPKLMKEDREKPFSDIVYPLLAQLFEAFGKPLVSILDRHSGIQDVILIPDSCTSLIPMVALFNEESRQFLGDKYCFRIVSPHPIGNFSHPGIIRIPRDSRSSCVVGDPTIPDPKYEKLPFAATEARTVAHLLKTTPLLHDQATKTAVLNVISGGNIIHLATHGNAKFLAFAGQYVDKNSYTLHSGDIENLSITPALVVLSSCYSGQGTMETEGIARAFLNAGAQAVLTTLWSIHDDFSATFIQFFYRYLMDGFIGSHALHKASISIRSFENSRYIHWSGYQLTGREFQFEVADNQMQGILGSSVAFPQLDIVMNLERNLISDPSAVQIIAHFNLKPSEIVKKFATNSCRHFAGGIFYINATNKHFLKGAEEQIKKVGAANSQPTLLIIENLTDLSATSQYLRDLLKERNTHVILTVNTEDFILNTLTDQITDMTGRKAHVILLMPLSDWHVTQRLVHGIVSRCGFVPYSREQEVIRIIVEKTAGSPDLVQVTSALLLQYIKRFGEKEFLREFYYAVCHERENLDFAKDVLRKLELSSTDWSLLFALSLCGSVPISGLLIHLISPTSSNLTSNHLLNICPPPVIQSPSQQQQPNTIPTFYQVPQVIADAVLKSMNQIDLKSSYVAVSTSLAQFYQQHLQMNINVEMVPFMAGVLQEFTDSIEEHEQFQTFPEEYRQSVISDLEETARLLRLNI